MLALFVPLIISSGGNSGSQASTLVIRAMALGEVTLTDWWRVIRREVLSGVMLGAILGAIGFLRIAIWSAFSTLYGPHWLLVATTVGARAGRHRAVGHAGRLDAAVRPAAARLRPGDLVGAVRRDAGRRHRAGHLLLGRHRGSREERFSSYLLRRRARIESHEARRKQDESRRSGTAAAAVTLVDASIAPYGRSR